MSEAELAIRIGALADAMRGDVTDQATRRGVVPDAVALWGALDMHTRLLQFGAQCVEMERARRAPAIVHETPYNPDCEMMPGRPDALY